VALIGLTGWGMSGFGEEVVRCSFDSAERLGADAARMGRSFANEGSVQWSPEGVAGGCARFCGKGSLVLKTLPDALRSKRPLSISFWFRFPALGRMTLLRQNFEYGFFGWGRAGSPECVTWACAGAKSRHDRTATPQTVKGHWSLHAYGGAGLPGAGGLYGAMTDRRWHQVVFTVDPVVRRVYLDGACRGEARQDYAFKVDPDGVFRIGASFWGNMDGWMDEFVIVDRALTEKEVAAEWAARPRERTDAVPPDAGCAPERVLTVTEPYWLFPVDNADKVGETAVDVFDEAGLPLDRLFLPIAAKGEGDWTSAVDVRAWRGKTVTLTMKPGTNATDALLNRIRPSAQAPVTAFDEPDRLKFHFTPPRGWMNDPNGLSYVNGEWRLMYQHVPYACRSPWNGNFFWGYATSRDLVHWEHHGDALKPYPGQRALISGSGVCDVGNTSGFGKDAHVICVCGGSPKGSGLLLWSSNDGRRYVPYAGNPVCRGPDLGADPKVIWHAPTKRWIMLTHGVKDGCYCIYFHSSPDLKNWQRESVYFGDHTSKGRQRFLHECPGLEELRIEGTSETAWVVWCAGPEYAIGQFDGHVFKPAEERLFSLAARGTPYYAGQSFQNAPDGRCVYIPWYRITPRVSRHFNQALGLPVDLALRRTNAGLRMTRRPVRELEALRDGEAVSMEAFSGELAEISVSAELGADARLDFDLRGIPLAYDAASERLSVRDGESVHWPLDRGRLSLRMYLDVAGLEVFSEDGLQCWPFINVTANPEKKTLGVRASGAVTRLCATAYRLKRAAE